MKLENSIERFERYAKVYTDSNPENSGCKPSSENQWDLLKMLHEELLAMGVNATLEDSGNVFVTIPANVETNAPKIGFLAHVDTAPEMTGKDVKPQYHKNYDGSKIVLNEEFTLDPEDFPELLMYKGQTIITTDGTTLLGADDKAGVTEIMEVIKYLVENPEFKHGELRFGFTTDEEIGCGTVDFDVAKFDADFAFTMDGGEVGELEYENFNAASATIKVGGRSVHPGTAKGQMINASIVLNQFINLLPDARPENTENYEGFIHITNLASTCDSGEISMIIRDHDKEKFNAKKALLEQLVAQLKTEFPRATFAIEIKDQYYNMAEKVVLKPEIMEIAKRGFAIADIEPKISPIRGGTDGSNLSFKGLPCPNIFAGGHNFHGRFEYLPAESMIKAQKVILGIIEAALEE